MFSRFLITCSFTTTPNMDAEHGDSTHLKVCTVVNSFNVSQGPLQNPEVHISPQAEEKLTEYQTRLETINKDEIK